MLLDSHVRALVQELQNIVTSSPRDDETSRREALRIVKILSTSLENPAHIAFETALLPCYSLCARVAVQLNIFSNLAESESSRTASELADLAGAEQLLVVRVMRILTGLGLVHEVDKETYAPSHMTKVMASPPIQAAQKHIWDQSVNSMAKLPEFLVERGLRCPADPFDGLLQYALNTNLEAWEYWHSKPGALESVNTLMTGVRSSRPSWYEWYPVEERLLHEYKPDGNATLLVDVGGGRGHDIGGFLERFPQPKGALVLQDLPLVIDDIDSLDDRIGRVKYNFFERQPVEGAKAYYFSHIFHNWADDLSVKILRNTAAAMSRDSKLLIDDMVLPNTKCSLLQAAFDINMMVMHAGIERTRDMWTELLSRAGLEVVNFWLPPGDGEGIVEARLKGE